MLSLFSCVWLCDTMGRSLPGSFVCEILQVGILEWVAIFSPGVLPYPGIEPMLLCLLHWQAVSLPLVHLTYFLPPLLMWKILSLICMYCFYMLTFCYNLSSTKPILLKLLFCDLMSSSKKIWSNSFPGLTLL